MTPRALSPPKNHHRNSSRAWYAAGRWGRPTRPQRGGRETAGPSHPCAVHPPSPTIQGKTTTIRDTRPLKRGSAGVTRRQQLVTDSPTPSTWTYVGIPSLTTTRSWADGNPRLHHRRFPRDARGRGRSHVVLTGEAGRSRAMPPPDAGNCQVPLFPSGLSVPP